MTQTIPRHDVAPRLMFDTRRINEDVSIREAIVSYTGIPVPNGSKNIKCPSVNHNDNHPSAHIYGNRCKCFSCGESFTPLTLARERYPELSFPDVCEQLLRDFDLDVYDYSNKAEVEAAMSAKRENRFYDHFPLTEEEFNFIGLQNPNPITKPVYYVKASEYYAFHGDEPSDEQVYDEDGNERIFAITESEAIDMELVPENIKDLRGNFTSPTLQQMWKQGKEDRDLVEEMLVGYARDTIERLNGEIEALTRDIQTTYHLDENAMDTLEDIADMYEEHRQKLFKGADFDYDAWVKDDKDFAPFWAFGGSDALTLRSLKDDRDRAEGILGKVLNLQERRASEGRTNKKEKESWGRE